MNKRQKKKFEKKNKYKTYRGYQLSMAYRYIEKKLQSETDSRFLQEFVHMMYKPFTHDEDDNQPEGGSVGFVSNLSIYKNGLDNPPSYEKMEVETRSIDDLISKLDEATDWLSSINGGFNNEQASEEEI